MTQSSQQRLLALAPVAIIAVLGPSASLIYTKVNQDKLLNQPSAERLQETQVKGGLETEY